VQTHEQLVNSLTAVVPDEVVEAARTSVEVNLGRSRDHYQRASVVVPAGTARSRFFWPLPVYAERGEGGYLFDVDGRKYIDCNLGIGPLLLGHRHPEVLDAIRLQLDRGVLFGAPVLEEATFAELLISVIPGAEQVILLNSGTEASMAALRIARAATGREKVGKFEGGWHGWQDGLFYSVQPSGDDPAKPETRPGSLGMARALEGTVVTLPFNDAAAFDRIRAEAADLACIIVEPIQGAAGCLVGDRSFLRELNRLCSELSIPLILDEVISGFRLGAEGAAGHYGLEPDMTMLGKAIGGGLPIGVLCGKKDLLSTLLPDSNGDAVVLAGTTSGNPITIAAANAQVSVLMRDDGAVYQKLHTLGQRMRNGLEAALAEAGVIGAVTGVGPWWGLHLGCSAPPANVREKSEAGRLASSVLAGYLNREGVHIMAPVHQAFLCTEHTEDDVDRVIEAHVVALSRMKEERLLDGILSA
jgi:glutamate-1-semialdehyde 2,1-aminomutase